jgi:DNA-directed RNA polymerase subunit M/transcription elongation factor TFIIS
MIPESVLVQTKTNMAVWCPKCKRWRTAQRQHADDPIKRICRSCSQSDIIKKRKVTIHAAKSTNNSDAVTVQRFTQYNDHIPMQTEQCHFPGCSEQVLQSFRYCYRHQQMIVSFKNRMQL